jgi:hypothetical protein
MSCDVAGEPPIANGIMANLLGSISSLSVQKFSSNVVEKCLELASDKMRAKLVDELVNPERLPRLLQDPYANYVIQKALSVSKKAQFERLVAVIKPHLAALRNTSFGKRIQNKILKKFPDLQVSFEYDPNIPGGISLGSMMAAVGAAAGVGVQPLVGTSSGVVAALSPRAAAAQASLGNGSSPLSSTGSSSPLSPTSTSSGSSSTPSNGSGIVPLLVSPKANGSNASIISATPLLSTTASASTPVARGPSRSPVSPAPRSITTGGATTTGAPVTPSAAAAAAAAASAPRAS